MNYDAVVIGTSAGGLKALKVILPSLPGNYGMPVIVVQHLGASSENYWINLLNELCHVHVKEADEKEKIKKGTVYIAPPNYHLLLEADQSLSLSTDEKVNYARPSIDVLFDSAAYCYGEKLVGVVLTGANSDGAKGLKKIQDYGGLAIVQDPATAEVTDMPMFAIEATKTTHVLTLEKIAEFLIKLDKQN